LAAGAGAVGLKLALESRIIEDVPKPQAYPVRQVTQTGVVHPTWTPPSRAAQISALESEYFDVLVVGGGATGSGVALDCASRGLKVSVCVSECE
jgi:hypothetical protein